MSTPEIADQVHLRRWDDRVDSLRELTALLHAAYAGHAAEGRFASYQTESDTAGRIAGAECWLAHSGGELVGTVTVAPPGRAKGQPCYEQPGVGTFYQLAVLPELTGRGVGERLMRKAEERLAASGADQVVIDTSEDASELLAWYEKRGYSRVGECAWDVTNYRSVVLAKPLIRAF